jgi:hypothetical protein
MHVLVMRTDLRCAESDVTHLVTVKWLARRTHLLSLLPLKPHIGVLLSSNKVECMRENLKLHVSVDQLVHGKSRDLHVYTENKAI